MDLSLFHFKNTQERESAERDEKHAPPTAVETAEVQNADAQMLWQAAQDDVAENSGLAILLVDGVQPPSLAVSNNNSVCRVIQSSPNHAHLCEPFCGKAHEKAQQAGESITYRCHAGLLCAAAPLIENPVRPLVAIVGRAYTTVSDYQAMLDRTMDGDWRELPADEMCRNLLFAESEEELLAVAEKMRKLSADEAETLVGFVARTEPNPFASETEFIETAEFHPPGSSGSNGHKPPQIAAQPLAEEDEDFPDLEIEPSPPLSAMPDEIPFQEEIAVIAAGDTQEDFAAWQMFTESLLDRTFKAACAETLRFLAVRYDLQSIGWLERNAGNELKPYLVAENLRERLTQFAFPADDPRLQAAVLDETSYRPKNFSIVELFPLAVGEDVRAAIAVADDITDEERRQRIARFCRQIAVSLEVLRLREELSRRAEIVRAVQLFNEKLGEADDEQLFDALMEICVETMQAERGSLLIFDEGEEKLKIVAAVGNFADEIRQAQLPVGERVAEKVWREGKPIVVENITEINLPPAPAERGYRSKSFICFPLITGNRSVGVLNVTDKRGGGSYTESDLDLLEAIAQQLAIALDRATFRQRAGVFEQLSITDSLTGLLNRRYLNERLIEETSRSNRDGSPMSFMMIDIDNFKQYNDRYGHQAGDEVLRITAQCLKASLRGADVAARFGGEEFSLLLPQTTLSEARTIGERIRERIEKTAFPHRQITISVGIAAYSALNNTPQEIIEAADQALYQAKRIGKNNVQLSMFGQTRR